MLLIEVRFKQYGVKSIEVIDNGCGIAEEDYDTLGKLNSLPVLLRNVSC